MPAKDTQTAPPKTSSGIASNALTPQPVYEKYLLYILAREFNGQGHKRDVTHAIVTCRSRSIACTEPEA